MSINPEDDNFSDDDSEVEIEVPVDTGKREFKIIEKGWQELVLTKLEKTTSGSGNPQYEATWRQGKLTTKDWYSLLPTAVWKLANVIMALDPDVKPGDKVKINKEKLVGRRLMANIIHEKSGEYTNAKIKSVKTHADGPIVAVDDLPF